MKLQIGTWTYIPYKSVGKKEKAEGVSNPKLENVYNLHYISIIKFWQYGNDAEIDHVLALKNHIFSTFTIYCQLFERSRSA